MAGGRPRPATRASGPRATTIPVLISPLGPQAVTRPDISAGSRADQAG
jgi:hypothetical protein